MLKKNTLKTKLIKCELSIGSWITLYHTSIPEIMAKAGFEWLVVDMEHSAITLSEAQHLIQVIEALGIIPLVRIGENNSNLIKRVMDAGASGIIVPMVNSKEDAEKAVSSVYYPTKGTRGVGLARAQGYGLSFNEYKNLVKDNAVVIAQIEHINAVNNLNEILSVDGIDGTIIGPYDLSASMGFPGAFERNEMKKAIESYKKICKKHKKPMGLHVIQPDANDVVKKIKDGFTFIAFSLDTLFLGKKCIDEKNKLNKFVKNK